MNIEDWKVMVIKTALRDAHKRINECERLDWGQFLLLLDEVYAQEFNKVFDCEDCFDGMG